MTAKHSDSSWRDVSVCSRCINLPPGPGKHKAAGAAALWVKAHETLFVPVNLPAPAAPTALVDIRIELPM